MVVENRSLTESLFVHCVFTSQRLVHNNLIALSIDEFFLLGSLNLNQMIVRCRGRTDKFVKFQLQGGLLAILRVFQRKEQHDHDGIRHRGKSHLPL